MVTMRTQALVLRSVDFGESDRVLHLLVPEAGRLTVIAKGARRSVKRFSGTLDYFNYLAVQIDRRRSTVMARLDQATLIRTYSSLRSDPKRFVDVTSRAGLRFDRSPFGCVVADFDVDGLLDAYDDDDDGC